MWVVTLTFGFILAGFGAGFLLQGHLVGFAWVLATLVYWLGILGGEGAEFERAALFATVGLLIAFFSKIGSVETLKHTAFYCLLAYLCVLTGIPLLKVGLRDKPLPFERLRDSFHKSFTRLWARHIYAGCFALTVLCGIWFARYFHFPRGYWIAITALLVMRADPAQSYYRSTQRFLGTALGVLLGDIFIEFHLENSIFLGVIVVCALLIPWALKRNYVAASLLVTLFIVFLLEIAATVHGDLSVPFIRLKATLVGCVLSALGTALARGLILGRERWTRGAAGSAG